MRVSFSIIVDEGYIERAIVADICHNGSNSTFEYRKGESQYTLWEGKNNDNYYCV